MNKFYQFLLIASIVIACFILLVEYPIFTLSITSIVFGFFTYMFYKEAEEDAEYRKLTKTLEIQLENSKNALQKLRERVQSQDYKITKLSNDKRDLQDKVKTLSNENRILESTKKNLTSRLQPLEKNFNKAVSDYQNEVHDNLQNDFLQKKSILEKRLQKKDSELREEYIQKLESEYSLREENLEALREELLEKEQQIIVNYRNKLQFQEKNSEEYIKNLESDYRAKEESLKSLRRELKKKTNNQNLQMRSDFENKMDNLEIERTQLHEQVESLKNEIQSEYQERTNAFEQEKITFYGEIENLKQRLNKEHEEQKVVLRESLKQQIFDEGIFGEPAPASYDASNYFEKKRMLEDMEEQANELQHEKRKNELNDIVREAKNIRVENKEELLQQNEKIIQIDYSARERDDQIKRDVQTGLHSAELSRQKIDFDAKERDSSLDKEMQNKEIYAERDRMRIEQSAKDSHYNLKEGTQSKFMDAERDRMRLEQTGKDNYHSLREGMQSNEMNAERDRMRVEQSSKERDASLRENMQEGLMNAERGRMELKNEMVNLKSYLVQEFARVDNRLTTEIHAVKENLTALTYNVNKRIDDVQLLFGKEVLRLDRQQMDLLDSLAKFQNQTDSKFVQVERSQLSFIQDVQNLNASTNQRFLDVERNQMQLVNNVEKEFTKRDRELIQVSTKQLQFIDSVRQDFLRLDKQDLALKDVMQQIAFKAEREILALSTNQDKLSLQQQEAVQQVQKTIASEIVARERDKLQVIGHLQNYSNEVKQFQHTANRIKLDADSTNANAKVLIERSNLLQQKQEVKAKSLDDKIDISMQKMDLGNKKFNLEVAKAREGLDYMTKEQAMKMKEIGLEKIGTNLLWTEKESQAREQQMKMETILKEINMIRREIDTKVKAGKSIGDLQYRLNRAEERRALVGEQLNRTRQQNDFLRNQIRYIH